MRASKEKSGQSANFIDLAGSRLQSFDFFGKQVPTFSLGGETKVNTKLGGLVSLIIMYTTLLFALLKWKHMQEYKNPNITSY